MSWSFAFKSTAPNYPTTSVHALDDWKATGGEGDPEMVAQAEAAIEAAYALIQSGTLHYLPSDGVYSVSLRGHSNPGHKPREGYAYDMIYINVDQVPEGGA